MTLLDRIQAIDGNAVPVQADRRAVLLGIEGDDGVVGYIEVTDVADLPGSAAAGTVVSIYGDWTEPPEAQLAVYSEDLAVQIVEYLVTQQPEGTDWVAWASQRIDDEGPDLARDADPIPPGWRPEPDPALAVQWQDSAPDMDYDEWLAAEIGIQLELLEDVPEDDYAGRAASYCYLVDITEEIRRRA
jgi:hypothetical protein